MKKLTHILLAAGALFAAALSSHAQTPPSVAVVDMAKIFNQHYAFLAEQSKLRAQSAQAQKDMDQMMKQRQDLIDEYKALQEQLGNPAMAQDAKAKTQSDLQAKGQEIQQKNGDIQKFASDARGTIQQQFVTFRTGLIESISQVAIRIAKSHNANLVLDKTGPSVIYADPSFDITQEVIDEINKNKPADVGGAPAASEAAPSASASGAAPSSEGAPQFSVPNVTPSK